MSEMLIEHAPNDVNSKASSSGYDFYRSIGSPKKIIAPMVDQSELSFRMLTRKYGADLVYTQMFSANCFAESAE